jgi:predicted dehydrogenase
MENFKDSRRNFIMKTVAGSAAIYAGGILPAFSAKSYQRIMGSNDRVNVCIMGVNSRGFAHAENYARQENCSVIQICDVDTRAIDHTVARVNELTGTAPKGFKDLRKALEVKELDAIVIAAPDHWHAPAALMGLKAGKHVYVEKPCSHSPHEGEILTAAAKKYGKQIQMGNQRRSWSNVIQAINDLKSGMIGRVYLGKSWYANTRESIGIGKEAPVPEWLDWELWQGPAPRKKYKDNWVHYNWHWFWHWGTGEALNNGTHMVDLLRWGMGVNFPVRVSSNGGRYQFKDDWETPDTQVITMDFPEGISLTWEGRSCNGKPVEGSSVGVVFYGEKGSLMIGQGNAYTVYNLKGEVLKDVKNDAQVNALNPTGPGEDLDLPHIRNFLNAIRNGEKLAADIDSGHKSTLLVQLGNIAQRVGHSLEIDPKNGHILADPKAQALWTRDYEKGWEMTL